LTEAAAIRYYTEADASNRMESRGSGSGVEHLLAKEKVAGSNPVSRSNERHPTWWRSFVWALHDAHSQAHLSCT
jgi:hypothetical protein